MKKTTQTAVSTLTQTIDATFVHGVTGRDVEEQKIQPGTLVRNVVERERLDGVETTFQLSDSQGAWYNYRTFDRLALRRVA